MKILIIDDEITALTKLKVLLTAYGECTMSTKSEQALRLYENSIQKQAFFDLVLIDIHLSEASGLDILESFTQMEVEAEVPHAIKIVVTASGTKENLIKAYSKGCDGFLVKPVKRDTLDEKLQSFGFEKIQASAQEAQPPNQHSEQTSDPKSDGQLPGDQPTIDDEN